MKDKRISVNIPLTDVSSMVLQFYDSGMPMSFKQYKGGKSHGVYMKFYENGCIALMCHYKNNRLSGEFRRWDCKGNITEFKNYKGGKLHGVCRYYGDNCSSVIQCIYNDGKLVERLTKYED